ncbi:twin-arginine translocase subunit TatC [Leucobacter aridicollis]|uniref:Sec-independent protein translocase protein TatC n=1 Tax=Leucobacter aridicollis TaxID=283878 RepID=A0A852R574_9MICO|nr:twin-arginine translocase subunit TatC [Leucobacter aridicollis]NYD26665.1 sec-independent protein translocase protein TatC [Leucobacter aridicollis]
MAKEGREPRNREGRMSLGEHLVELRKRLIYVAIGLAIGLVGGFLAVDWVWDMLREPINALQLQGRNATLTYGAITEAFDLRIQIALFIAVVISAPIWLYQVWAFLAPGLNRKEKLYGVGFLAAAVPLFLAGVYAAWSVLPNIVRLMSTFQPSEDAFFLSARLYIDFSVKLMLAVGVGFVMPVVLVMLNFVGIIRGKTILKGWRVAILIIVLFAALTTPAADLWSMFLLAVPMVLLYFIAVGIAMLHDRRVDKRRAAEFAEYGVDLSAPDLRELDDDDTPTARPTQPREANTDT